jgi:hypothetical protein
MDTLGRRFANALAAKDEAALTSLLAAGIDFKGLTPGRVWEAEDPAGVLDILLGSWFEPQDQITSVLGLAENEDVADTAHVGYRFALTTPEGGYVAEQQVYYRTQDEQITHLRVMCSGFRPA